MHLDYLFYSPSFLSLGSFASSRIRKLVYQLSVLFVVRSGRHLHISSRHSIVHEKLARLHVGELERDLDDCINLQQQELYLLELVLRRSTVAARPAQSHPACSF